METRSLNWPASQRQAFAFRSLRNEPLQSHAPMDKLTGMRAFVKTADRGPPAYIARARVFIDHLADQLATASVTRP